MSNRNVSHESPIQIHHAVYCFITAYGTERMLVLKSKGWRYDKAGFEDVFHPLSETCPHEKAVSKGRLAYDVH